MTENEPHLSAAAQAAFEVQSRLLQDPPDMEAIDLAVSWQPFAPVGGDFYDFTPLEEGSLGITLGDISGKGYNAALLMVYALAEIRARLKNHERLPHIMAQLDESLRKFSDDAKYAEVLVGIYLPFDRKFIYVQGGKIEPVVFHNSNQKIRFYHSSTFRIPGLSIPVGRRSRFVLKTIDLRKGDTLALFTDGVTERLDRDGQEIFRKRMDAWVAPSIEKILSEHSKAKASEKLDALNSYLEDLESERSDDQTIIILKAD